MASLSARKKSRRGRPRVVFTPSPSGEYALADAARFLKFDFKLQSSVSAAYHRILYAQARGLIRPRRRVGQVDFYRDEDLRRLGASRGLANKPPSAVERKT